MEIKINAVLIKDIDNIDVFLIRVNEKKAKLVKEKLKQQYNKIVNITKELREQGKIRSLSMLKDVEITKQVIRDGKITYIKGNKTSEFQKKLDNLTHIKRVIKQSLDILSEFY